MLRYLKPEIFRLRYPPQLPPEERRELAATDPSYGLDRASVTSIVDRGIRRKPDDEVRRKGAPFMLLTSDVPTLHLQDMQDGHRSDRVIDSVEEKYGVTSTLLFDEIDLLQANEVMVYTVSDTFGIVVRIASLRIEKFNCNASLPPMIQQA